MRITIFTILLCNFNIATTICLLMFANKRHWPQIPAQYYSKTSFTVSGTGVTAIFLILCLERVALDWEDGLAGKSACCPSIRTWVWIPSTHQGCVFLQPSDRRPDGADHHLSSRSETCIRSEVECDGVRHLRSFSHTSITCTQVPMETM